MNSSAISRIKERKNIYPRGDTLLEIFSFMESKYKNFFPLFIYLQLYLHTHTYMHLITHDNN